MKPADWTAPYFAHTWIHGLDPRVRIVTALLLAGVVVALKHLPPLMLAAAIAALLALGARFTPRQWMYRLSSIAALGILLAAFLPLQAWTCGQHLHVAYDASLLPVAGTIALKAATVIMLLMGLVGTIEPVALGHALIHLHIPRTLVQLYLFTIRYLDIVRREMSVMHTAMLARGFQPHLSGRHLVWYGHLVGMLLIRSLDRGERVVRAMKCRGYHGAFYLYHHFHYAGRDAAWAAVAVILAAALLIGDRI